MGIIWGVYDSRDNGKENGSYCILIGIMEHRMETTIEYIGVIQGELKIRWKLLYSILG